MEERVPMSRFVSGRLGRFAVSVPFATLATLAMLLGLLLSAPADAARNQAADPQPAEPVIVVTPASGASAVAAAQAPAQITPTQAPPQAPLDAPPEPAAPATAASAPEAPASAPTPDAPPAQRMRWDPEHDAERGDLWQRVRNNFSMRDLDGDIVRKWEQRYARDPAYVGRMAERGGRYMFHILEEVQRRNLPVELALLPFVESAFNPQAMSVARASGMWQFMPGTGRDYALRQNLFRDDRRDVLASTRAALDYLQKLNTMFGDWHLALAAYNWGQGSVQKAQAYNRDRGLPQDYESLRMPQETRDYVPKLQAVKNIIARPDAFSLSLPALGDHPYFLSVPIERDIDVALAASLADLPLEAFQQLNPQMNKPVILAAGTPQVLLPYDNANRFMQQIKRHNGALATWTAWVAPKTLKPTEAARLTGMDEATLRDVNRIPPRMLVKAGSTLLVPRSPHSQRDVTVQVADSAAIALAHEPVPLRRVAFKAGRKGDTVAAVAKRYRVSAAQVASWNKVAPNASFKAGQAVVLMLPTGKAKAGAHAKTHRAHKSNVKMAGAGKSSQVGKMAAAKKTGAQVRRASAARKSSAKTAAKAPGKAAGKTASKSAKRA
jgi:membrane-bound lytic murein transglycosylase D